MEIKALVLLGLLGVFASGVEAESSTGRLILPAKNTVARGDGSRVSLEKRLPEENERNGPLNVILVLVDELYRSDVNAYLENKDAFPFHGHLQICSTGYTDESRGCDCEEKLGSSIASLLSWAQQVKGITSSLYEVPNEVSGPRARLMNPQRYEAPRVLQIEPFVKSERTNLASKTDTFLRSLVNGLNAYQSHKPSIVQSSNVAELTLGALKELNWMPNKSGHLVILHTGVNRLGNVLELLKRHVSPSDTLTVVMSSCSQVHTNSVPFFADGVGSKQLSHINLKQLHDLPAAIRTIMGDRDYIPDEEKKVILTSADIEGLERYKREPENNGTEQANPGQKDGKAALDAPSGVQEIVAPLPMMIVTLTTTIITYAIKF